MNSRPRTCPLEMLAGIQGAYFLFTGLWPLIHIRSFLAVTGEKEDIWLVETVGVLVSAIGFGLVIAAWRRHIPAEVAATAALSAAGLALIDAIYVLRGRISSIYLLDVGIEVVVVACWAIFWMASSVRPTRT